MTPDATPTHVDSRRVDARRQRDLDHVRGIRRQLADDHPRPEPEETDE